MLGVNTIKLLRIILSITVIVMASSCLITSNFELMPYVLMIMGVNSFVTGNMELKAKRKTNAIFSFFAGTFAFFVGIYIFTGTLV